METFVTIEKPSHFIKSCGHYIANEGQRRPPLVLNLSQVLDLLVWGLPFGNTSSDRTGIPLIDKVASFYLAEDQNQNFGHHPAHLMTFDPVSRTASASNITTDAIYLDSGASQNLFSLLFLLTYKTVDSKSVFTPSGISHDVDEVTVCIEIGGENIVTAFHSPSLLQIS